MNRSLVFILSLLISELACACGSDMQQVSMTKRLYADTDMQRFVCAGDSCSLEEFKNGLRFHQYDEPFHGRHVLVCLVEPVLSATNSYTGIFASTGGKFELQFISYGTGVKVGANKAGVPMISEYSVSDPDNPDYSVNRYLWKGKAFVFVRNVDRFGMER